MATRRKRTGTPSTEVGVLQKSILFWMLESDPRPTPLSEAEGVTPLSFDRHLIHWTPDRFTGENPTQSKSAAVSKALAALEKRGYVSRFDFHDGKGGEKRIATTHVSFTYRGRLMAEALSTGAPAGEADGKLHAEKLKDHIRALEGALEVLKPLADQDDAKARRAWMAVLEDKLRHQQALERAGTGED